MNTQPIEKRQNRQDGLLDVHSIFYTIQGEGPFCGTPAVFIRLAGCNLQCPSCDTDYTSTRTLQSPLDILNRVINIHRVLGGLVVITGGEPFRQNIKQLIWSLNNTGFYVQIESNGVLPPPEDVLWNTYPDQRENAFLVVSPKAGKVHPEAAKRSCCFKYVLAANSVDEDGLPKLALNNPANPRVARPPAGYDRPIYLQPMDSNLPWDNDANLKAVLKSCMTHGYILQLQIHKLLGVE